MVKCNNNREKMLGDWAQIKPFCEWCTFWMVSTASVELTYSLANVLNSVLTYCGDLKKGKWKKAIIKTSHF